MRPDIVPASNESHSGTPRPFTSSSACWIAGFWALQAGGPSKYRGGFGAAHISLGLKPEHFQHWLGLWEFNNARQLRPPEAAEMTALAHEFGRRLFALTQGRRA